MHPENCTTTSKSTTAQILYAAPSKATRIAVKRSERRSSWIRQLPARHPPQAPPLPVYQPVSNDDANPADRSRPAIVIGAGRHLRWIPHQDLWSACVLPIPGSTAASGSGRHHVGWPPARSARSALSPREVASGCCRKGWTWAARAPATSLHCCGCGDFLPNDGIGRWKARPHGVRGASFRLTPLIDSAGQPSDRERCAAQHFA